MARYLSETFVLRDIHVVYPVLGGVTIEIDAAASFRELDFSKLIDPFVKKLTKRCVHYSKSHQKLSLIGGSLDLFFEKQMHIFPKGLSINYFSVTNIKRMDEWTNGRMDE